MNDVFRARLVFLGCLWVGMVAQANMYWDDFDQDYVYFENASSHNYKAAAFGASLASLTTDNPRLVMMVVYSTNCSHCTTVSNVMRSNATMINWLSQDFVLWPINERKHGHNIGAYVKYLSDITPDLYPLLAIIDPRDDTALRASRGSSFLRTASDFQAYFQGARPVPNAPNVQVARAGGGAVVEWDTLPIRPELPDNVLGFVVARYPGPPPAGEFFLANRTAYGVGQTVNGWRIVASGPKAGFPAGGRGGHQFTDTAALVPDVEYTYRVFAYNDFTVDSATRRLYSGGVQATSETALIETPPVAEGSVVAGNRENHLSWTHPGGAASQFLLLAAGSPDDLPEAIDNGLDFTAGDALGAASVLYVGGGTAFTHGALNNGTARHYRIFARDEGLVYSVAFMPAGSPATPNFLAENVAQATVDDGFSCAVELAWRNPHPTAGNMAGVFILRAAGDVPPEGPAEAQALRNGGGGGSTAVADLSVDGGAMVANQMAAWRDDSAQNSATYHYKIFAYDSDGTFSSGVATVGATPTFAHARLTAAGMEWTYDAVGFSGVGDIVLQWSYDLGQCVAGVLILHTPDAPVTETPQSGTAYTLGQPLGSAHVVYVGPGSPARADGTFSFADIDRPPGMTHHYKIFPYNDARAYGPGRSVSTDANGNGLDDKWSAHFGVYDPYGDADGDNLSNRYEFVHGSNPTDANDPNLIPEGFEFLPAGWHNRPLLLSSDRGGNVGTHIKQFIGYNPAIWYWDATGGGFRDGRADAVGSKRSYWFNLHSPVHMLVETPAGRAAVTNTVDMKEGWNNVAFPQWICDRVGEGREYATLGDFLSAELGAYWNGGKTLWRWQRRTGSFENAAPVSSLEARETFWFWVPVEVSIGEPLR